MKKNLLSNIVLVIMLMIGLSLLLYPSFSDYWNSKHQTKAIAVYSEEVKALDKVNYEEIWESAREYNEELLQKGKASIGDEKQQKKYQELLNISGNGIMGYIEIPEIGCMLPIYHGVDDVILQIAIGHLEWSSLPVGGEGTHCVISGHRGLPSAKLFTDLDKLAEGDLFMMRILDELLTYEVDQILIVEPHELEALEIEEGKDLCTLVTCTPYGVNSHRLLVRGHRVENIEEASAIRVMADAIRIEPVVVAPIVALPILFGLFIVLLVRHPKSKKKP